MIVVGFFKWAWSVWFYHGWWKFNPRKWRQISKERSKAQQSLPFDRLPAKYKKRGTPVHSIRCRVCNETWWTSCKLPLCNKFSCWMKYYARRKMYEARKA